MLEYLNFARLHMDGSPSLGPDATGVSWVYQYVLLVKSKPLANVFSSAQPHRAYVFSPVRANCVNVRP